MTPTHPNQPLSYQITSPPLLWLQHNTVPGSLGTNCFNQFLQGGKNRRLYFKKKWHKAAIFPALQKLGYP